MTKPIRIFALCLAASLPIALQAQQPANPMDNVPEIMPYDIPYGPPISLEKADALINAAIAEAQKHHWKMNVAVVDSGANLVAFKRMNDAQLASIQISEHKARAAAKYRRETKIFESAMQNGSTSIATLDDIVASRGGIPLVVEGKLIGAIGCSGGTGSQDEVACKAAVALLAK